MIRRSSATSSADERRAERGVEPRGVLGRRRASRASATSTVRLPSTRSSPAGLPVDVRVAEHPEQVVAQLERLAERQPERASARPSVAASAPASAAPMCSGRSMEYFADL